MGTYNLPSYRVSPIFWGSFNPSFFHGFWGPSVVTSWGSEATSHRFVITSESSLKRLLMEEILRQLICRLSSLSRYLRRVWDTSNRWLGWLEEIRQENQLRLVVEIPLFTTGLVLYIQTVVGNGISAINSTTYSL